VPVHTGSGNQAASCKTGNGSFPTVKCGRGVLLSTHPLLVLPSWKSRAIPLPTLWRHRSRNGITLYLPLPLELQLRVSVPLTLKMDFSLCSYLQVDISLPLEPQVDVSLPTEQQMCVSPRNAMCHWCCTKNKIFEAAM